MKGIGVKVPVAADRTRVESVLIPCSLSEGGVQGLRWCARRFRIDEDGDVADEFLNEFSLSGNQTTETPVKFEVKYNTKPAAIKKQTISTDGNARQSLVYQGRTQLV